MQTPKHRQPEMKKPLPAHHEAELRLNLWG